MNIAYFFITYIKNRYMCPFDYMMVDCDGGHIWCWDLEHGTTLRIVMFPHLVFLDKETFASRLHHSIICSQKAHFPISPNFYFVD